MFSKSKSSEILSSPSKSLMSFLSSPVQSFEPLLWATTYIIPLTKDFPRAELPAERSGVRVCAW